MPTFFVQREKNYSLYYYSVGVGFFGPMFQFPAVVPASSPQSIQ